jgi:hypothetical protein
MSADGSDESAEDDDFVAEYEYATEADVIDPDGDDVIDEEPHDGDDEGAVAGSFAPDVTVTPQMPVPEHVAFVAAGVYLTILALLETIPGIGTSLPTIAVVTAGVAAVTLVCYRVLVWTTPGP